MNTKSTNSKINYQNSKIISKKLPSRMPEFPATWKVGKYWDNSGTQNAMIAKNAADAKIQSFRMNSGSSYRSLESLPRSTSRNTGVAKMFSSNSESKNEWNPKSDKQSMMNYQNRDYNFITHTVTSRPCSVTSNKLKGFGQLIDSSKPKHHDLNPVYQEVLKNNPKVFYRQSGEFTQHHNSCVRLSGFGPFFRVLS